MEKSRLEKVIERINSQKIHLVTTPRISPFAFPIMVDRLSRNSLSSESIEDRVLRLQAELLA